MTVSTKRKIGRPKGRIYPYCTVIRLPRKLEKQIKQYAKSKDWSMNKALNHILEDSFD